MNFGNFANYGFVRDTVPKDLLTQLEQEVTTINLNGVEHNKSLAGNIQHEYKLERSVKLLEPYLIMLCDRYIRQFDPTYTAHDLSIDNLSLDSLWVNIQKAGEFNPIHMHDGKFSFAIWLKIPYSYSDQINLPWVAKSNMPRAGMFSFIYTNIFGEIREAELPVDKSYEGEIFLFPSKLNHQVYPFYNNDKFRISVSGNLK